MTLFSCVHNNITSIYTFNIIVYIHMCMYTNCAWTSQHEYVLSMTLSSKHLCPQQHHRYLYILYEQALLYSHPMCAFLDMQYKSGIQMFAYFDYRYLHLFPCKAYQSWGKACNSTILQVSPSKTVLHSDLTVTFQCIQAG